MHILLFSRASPSPFFFDIYQPSSRLLIHVSFYYLCFVHRLLWFSVVLKGSLPRQFLGRKKGTESNAKCRMRASISDANYYLTNPFSLHQHSCCDTILICRCRVWSASSIDIYDSWTMARYELAFRG